MAAYSTTVSRELLSSLQIMSDGWLAWQLQAEEYKKYYQPTSLSMPLTFLRPQSSTSPLYQFQHAQGEIFSFNLRPTSINGDCFFDAVNRPGFTRDALVKKLLDNPTESIRAIFGHEIRQFLYLGYTGSHPNKQESQACQQLLTPGVQKLFLTLQEVEAVFRPRVDEARLELGTRETHQKHPPELLTLLRQRNSHLVQRFEQAYQGVLNADKAIYEYCCQTDIFKRYVELYLKEARGYIPFSRDFGREIPTTTIDVINQLFGLKIQVYLPCTQGKTQLQLANQLQTGDVIPIFHNGINHFWGLNIVPKLSEASVPTVNLHQRDTSLGEQKLACEHPEINAVHMRLPEEVKSQEEVKGKSELHSLTSVESEASIKQQVIPKLEHIKAKHLLATDWQQEGANFIPMRGTWHVNSTQDFGLDEEINKFLSTDKKVLLLLGDSGAGKSLYTQGLAINLWKAYKNETPIPIWISLPSLKSPTTRAIEETFEAYGFTIEQIKYLQRTHSFVFILDAYDEMNNLSNLFVGNHLAEWKAKIIITCRREYLYYVDNYRKFFMPFQGERALYSSYTEIIVSPFNEKQIQDYFENYNRNRGTERINWQLYQQALDEIPGLKKLTTTPFILKLAIEALPGIIQRFKETEPEKRKKLTQAALYDVFIEQWFSRQEQKLKNSKQIAEDENIKPEFWKYAKELAEAMHKQAVTQINYETSSSDLFDPIQVNPWERFFNPTHQRLGLLRTACLVREVSPNRYAFIHPSLGEYFLTRKLFEDLSSSCSSYETKNQETLFSNSTTLTMVESQEGKGLNEYFNQRLLVKESGIIQFFAENVDEYPDFRQSLFNRIYASKNNPQASIAASNAITILNMAKINFSGLDFSHAFLSYANLQEGRFSGSNFTHADLSNVIFKNSILHNANLSCANMIGVQFNEKAYLHHSGMVINFSIAKDTELLASSSDEEVHIWNLKTGKLIKIFNVPGCFSSLTVIEEEAGTKVYQSSCTIDKMNLSADGSLLAIIHEDDKDIEIWDTASGKLLRSLCGHTSDITDISLSTDGKLLASASLDHTVRLWNVSNGQLLTTIEHKSGVEAICLSADKTILASGSHGETIRLWDIEHGKQLKILTDSNSSNSDYLCFSENGKLLVSKSSNKVIRLWEISTGELLGIFEGISASLNTDNKTLAILVDENTVKVWDVLTGDLIQSFSEHVIGVTAICFINDKLYTAGNDNNIRIWENISINTSIDSYKNTNEILRLQFSVDGRTLNCMSKNEVYSWNVVNGHLQKIFRNNNVIENLPSKKSSKGGVKGLIYKVKQFSKSDKKTFHENDCLEEHDSLFICNILENNTVQVSDKNSGKLINIFKTNRKINSTAFNMSNSVLACACNDGIIKLWDIFSGKELHTLRGKNHPYIYATAMKFYGDNCLALGFSNGSVNLWEYKAIWHGQKWLLSWNAPFRLFWKDALIMNTKNLSSDNLCLLQQQEVEEDTLLSEAFDKDVFFKSAFDNMQSGNFRESLKYFKALYKEDPFDHYLHYNLACCYYLLGTTLNDDTLFQEAGRYFREAISLRLDADTFTVYGNFLYMRMQYEESIIYLRKAVKFKTTNAGLVYGAGKRMLLPEELRAEIDTWGAVKIKAIFMARYLLICAYHMTNQKDQANKQINKFKKLVESDKERDPFLYSLLGYGYKKLGLLNEAAYWFNLAIERTQDYDLAKSNHDECLRCLSATNNLFLSSIKGPVLQEISSLNPTDKPINCISCFLDEKWLAMGIDKEIHIWGSETNCLRHVLKGHTEEVISIHFSPDSQMLVSGGVDCNVILWDIIEFKLTKALKGHTDKIISVNFSPFGTLIASSSKDNTIRLWRVNQGILGCTMNKYTAKVTNVHFSPSGRLLASADHNGNICIWPGGINLGKDFAEPFYQVKFTNIHFKCVQFNPNESMVAAGTKDGRLILWHFKEQLEDKQVSIIKAREKQIDHLRFGQSDNILIFCSKDKTIDYRLLKEGVLGAILTNHTQSISDIQFNPQGIVVSSSKDGSICFSKFNDELLSKCSTSHELKQFNPINLSKQFISLTEQLDLEDSLLNGESSEDKNTPLLFSSRLNNRTRNRRLSGYSESELSKQNRSYFKCCTLL